MGFRVEKKSEQAKQQVTEAPAEKDGDTVRISFRMGRSLHTRLKHQAVRQGHNRGDA